MTISEVAIADLKARNPCDQVAAKWVTLRRHGTSLIGPCPICSENRTSRKATKFQCWPDRWACAGACADGGDVIKLVMKVEGLDFLRAVDWLGGAQEIDPAKAAEREKERTAARERAEKESGIFRERARGKAFDTWHQGKPLAGSPVEQYLRLRGLSALPERLPLRFAPQLAYFHGEEVNEIGRKAPRIIYRGPAMLAPIVDASGRFRALHTTWLDLSRPSGKALIKDPETGDELPAKKVRGSKAGNRIELVAVKDPAQLIIGEGIETVLSVWLALERAGDDLARTAFWSGVDLGNIGGRAAETVSHPTLKSDAGRALRIPGPYPASGSAAIAIPDAVTDIVLLGDSDSDRVKTECALVRAAARWARASLAVHLAWAPPGRDFNDLLRAAA